MERLIALLMAFSLFLLTGCTNANTEDGSSESAVISLEANVQEKGRKQEETLDNGMCSLPLAEHDLGIQLSVTDISPTGLTLLFSQSGGEPTGRLQTGTQFFIEEQVNGDWQEVKSIEDIVWTAEALVIEEDGYTTMSIDWSFIYGTLPNGKYRIGKDVDDFRASGDYDIYTYYAEFEIAE